ncbi:hypothetical protein [Dyella mobilis]|uniref:Uncharacterized protein n=1 Tax=Dyella mobilis TaxID=1849582 RepID=A0ABS2KC79_9GAMM|nr:hypothetical protein [Dyella mobilis]MBM7128458.1 hypothetical protein [Dyella mobilis]
MRRSGFSGATKPKRIIRNATIAEWLRDLNIHRRHQPFRVRLPLIRALENRDIQTPARLALPQSGRVHGHSASTPRKKAPRDSMTCQKWHQVAIISPPLFLYISNPSFLQPFRSINIIMPIGPINASLKSGRNVKLENCMKFKCVIFLTLPRQVFSASNIFISVQK